MPDSFALDINGERIEVNEKSGKLNYPIKDISSESAHKFGKILRDAGLVLINGPPGYYENSLFAKGGEIMFSYLRNAKGKIVLCGGNTIPIIEHLGISNIYHKSTGGGAASLFLGTESLPLIAALENKTYIKNSLEMASNILTDYGKKGGESNRFICLTMHLLFLLQTFWQHLDQLLLLFFHPFQHHFLYKLILY